MGWYTISDQGQRGPFTDPQIIDTIRKGELHGHSALLAEGGSVWITAKDYPPFASVLPPQATPGAAPRGGSEALGYAVLIIPLVGIALTWLWVGNMNLLQDPATALNTVAIATVLLTAVLIAVEASQVGFGKLPMEKGKKGNGPVTWFFAVVFLWLSAFPWYLHKRKHYGRASLVVGGTLVFTGSTLAMVASIESAKANARQRLEDAMRQFQ